MTRDPALTQPTHSEPVSPSPDTESRSAAISRREFFKSAGSAGVAAAASPFAHSAEGTGAGSRTRNERLAAAFAGGGGAGWLGAHVVTDAGHDLAELVQVLVG